MKISSNVVKSSFVALSLAFLYNAYSEPISVKENEVENRLSSLEVKINTGLKKCIEELEPNSIPQIAFLDALQELREFNMVISHFHTPALEQYGVNEKNNPCYRANEDIKRMNEIIESNL